MKREKPDRDNRGLSLPWLIGAVATVALLAPAAYFWHAHQMHRIGGALLERAEALEQEAKWSEAASYLQRYLKLHPEDADVRIRMAQCYDRSATSTRKKTQAIDLYYRAAGLAPERSDLRGRLAELLLEVGRYDAAREQADEVLRLKPKDAAGVAVRALAMYALAKSGPVVLEDALAEMQQAAAEQPANMRLVESLVYIYRHQWRGGTKNESIQLADAAMNRMVEADPKNADLYLSRHRYRLRYQREGAEADLEQALELAPQAPGVLLAAAQFATLNNRPAEAIALYEELIQHAPRHPGGYLGLGDCYVGAGQGEDAIKTWQKGLAFDPTSLTLHYRLAELLIKRVELDAAKDPMHALERLVASSEDADYWRKVVDLLHAKWHIAAGEPAQAVPRLKRIANVAEVATADHSAPVQLEASLLLGEIYAQAREWDLAAAAYKLAVVLRPSLGFAHLSAARAFAAAGQLDAAIEQCRQLTIQPDADPEALILQAQLQFARQFANPADQRDWTAVELALAAAETASPNGWQLRLLKADLLAAQGQVDAPQQILEILRAAETEHPEASDLWSKLVLRYERLARPQDADRALKRFVELAGDATSAALQEAELLYHRGEFERAEDVLNTVYEQSGGPQRRQVGFALVDVKRRQGQLTQARRYLLELAHSNPSDIEPPRQLAELALESSDFVAAERWQDTLRELEGPDGCNWQLLKARRLLAQAASNDDPRFHQAAQIQMRVESLRPTWFHAHTLKAMIAEREGKRDRAIDAYRAAIQLGGRTPQIYERLIRLLHDQRRFAEADHFLAELKHFRTPPPELAALEISIAAESGQADRAVRLARQAAESQPDDPLARVRLGHTLIIAGDNAAAEEEFNEAVRLNPRELRTWAGLFSCYLQSRRLSEALETLNRLAKQAKLSEDERRQVLTQGHIALARAHETEGALQDAGRHFVWLLEQPQAAAADFTAYFEFLLRHRDDAAAGWGGEAVDQFVEQALYLHPNDVTLLFTIGSLRIFQQRADDAIVLLRRVTDIEPRHFLAWNNLAAMLSERPADREQALQYIDRAIELAGSEIPLLMDTKATVLLHLGRASEAAALLEDFVRTSRQTDPRFHFLLSIAYERMDDLAAARRSLETAHELGLSKSLLSPVELDLLAQLDTRFAE